MKDLKALSSIVHLKLKHLQSRSKFYDFVGVSLIWHANTMMVFEICLVLEHYSLC